MKLVILGMLKNCSLERDDTELHEYLATDPSAVYVQEKYRKRYIKVPKQTKSEGSLDDSGTNHKNLGSSSDQFDWKQSCFLCGKVVSIDLRHPDSNSKFCTVLTIEM